MSSKLTLYSSVVVAIAALSGATSAQEPCRPSEIVRFEDPRQLTGFGTQMGLSGDALFVGARADTVNGIRSGSVTVYRHEGTQWTREALLVPCDPFERAEFGRSLDIDGDVIIVGARRDEGRGAAYVFRFDGDQWIEEAKLQANDIQSDWHFGHDVAIRGETAVVAATGADEQRGAVYLFRYAGGAWTQTDKLVAWDGRTSFGLNISFGNNVLAVQTSSSTYILRYDGAWRGEAIIHNGRTTTTGCGIDADLLLIGSAGDNELGELAGAAFIFRFDGSNWNREAKLLAGDGAAGERFGRVVGLGDGVAAIGAYPEGGLGSAYLFKLDGKEWTEVAKLTPSSPQSRSRFGIFVSIDEHRVLVGAHAEHPRPSAYLFGSVLDCDMNGELDICDIERGESEDCNRNGLADQCEKGFDHSDKDGDGVPGECDNCPLFNPRQIDPCDMNCDGTVDALDIEPFIELLFGGETPCAPCVGDANADGLIDAMDIEPFLSCLFP